MVTICFYTAKSYDKLKQVADDKQNLCDSYAEWLVEYTKLMGILKEKGLHVIPLTVNIDDLMKWCKEKNYKNTSDNRAKYAQEMGRLIEHIKLN